MNKNQKTVIAVLEMITTQHGHLTGGFSAAMALDDSENLAPGGINIGSCPPISNNCNGGNCVPGCGGKP